MEKIKLEIERKFLVNENWSSPKTGLQCIQGYISADKEKVVRVRIMDHHAWLTIKSLKTNITRMEFEIEISTSDAEELLKLCPWPLIDKTRYHYTHKGHTWEIDEFHGANEGLIIAEIELENENQTFDKPDFIDKEVSNEGKYYNSRLTKNPFSEWPATNE